MESDAGCSRCQESAVACALVLAPATRRGLQGEQARGEALTRTDAAALTRARERTPAGRNAPVEKASAPDACAQSAGAVLLAEARYLPPLLPKPD